MNLRAAPGLPLCVSPPSSPPPLEPGRGGVYFDSGPPREPRKLSSSQLENEAEGKRERERE